MQEPWILSTTSAFTLKLKIHLEFFIKHKKFFVFLQEAIPVLAGAGTEFSCIVYVSKFHSSNILL
jgi:hypothetical protein